MPYGRCKSSLHTSVSGCREREDRMQQDRNPVLQCMSMSRFPSLRLVIRFGWCGRTEYLGSYERAFSQALMGRPMPALAFWRGRVALWTILRAVGIEPGDQVAMPAYTCEIVPIAVRLTGGRPVYADVVRGQFNVPIQSMEQVLGQRTKAVVCQHTYGTRAPLRGYKRAADTQNAVLVEDCCQVVSVPSESNGVATTGAAAFFSTQWNKPVSTGLGGIAVFREPELHRRARLIREEFSQKGMRRRAWLLALQVLMHELSVFPSTRAIVGKLYRFAQRAGLIRGTTTADEFGDTMPADYLAGATNVQAILGLHQLRRWEDSVRHRRGLTAFYLDALSTLGVDVAPLMQGEGQPVLWAVPVLVENKKEILRRAAWTGVPIATWFDRIPAHIHPDTCERYGYRPGQCPRTEKLFPREIHLPTAPWVRFPLAEKAIDLLKQHARFSSV